MRKNDYPSRPFSNDPPTPPDEEPMAEGGEPMAEGEEADIGGEGYEEEAGGEQERNKGCGWVLILSLALILGLIGIVTWGLREIATRGVLPRLTQSFGDVSVLPAAHVQPVKAEMQIRIYYIVRGQALAAETRQLPAPAGAIERMHLIARQLATQPVSRFLQNPLPKGTSIRALYVVDNVLWLDLSSEFLKPDNPSPLRERLVVYSLVNSFLLNDPNPSQPTVVGVCFMVDGKPIDSAWGWLDLSSPLGADLSLIR